MKGERAAVINSFSRLTTYQSSDIINESSLCHAVSPQTNKITEIRT